MGEIGIAGWAEQVDEILFRCENTSTDRAALITDIHRLLAEGPASLCGAMRPAISRSELAGLLDVGAFESAALRLLAACGYMLSRDSGGLVIASVVTPSSNRDYSFNASSEDVALSGALMTSIQQQITSA
jgi:hypothetical protein